MRSEISVCLSGFRRLCRCRYGFRRTENTQLSLNITSLSLNCANRLMSGRGGAKKARSNLGVRGNKVSQLFFLTIFILKVRRRPFFLANVMLTGSCRSAEINVAEGRKQAAILKSEAEKAQLINEAEGQVKIVFNKHMWSWKCFYDLDPGSHSLLKPGPRCDRGW